MWLQMPNSCPDLIPHPPMSLTHPAIYHPLLPLPKIRLTQKKLKVPPQDLILRVMTPLRPIAAVLKSIISSVYIFFSLLLWFI